MNTFDLSDVRNKLYAGISVRVDYQKAGMDIERLLSIAKSTKAKIIFYNTTDYNYNRMLNIAAYVPKEAMEKITD